MNIDKKLWKVASIAFDKAAQLVKQYHYSHSHSKQDVALHGLYMACDGYAILPYGLCWWIPPAAPSIAHYCSEDWKGVLCLSRMVILPDAPRNAASFLLSRSIKLLPERYHTLITYADTWQGHTGAIYRATNWHYDGLTQAKPIYLDENGSMTSTRRGQRTLSIDTMNRRYKFLGKFAKHRFIFYRERREEKQLSMF